MPEMTSQELAYYLARIQDALTPPELQDIAEDAQKEHPADEATPRIAAMPPSWVGGLPCSRPPPMR